MHEKSWRIEVTLVEDEDGGETRASAVVVTGDRRDLRGDGVARRNPADADVPRIGDELATARALAELAHRLLETAARDIEDSTHASVRRP